MDERRRPQPSQDYRIAVPETSRVSPNQLHYTSAQKSALERRALDYIKQAKIAPSKPNFQAAFDIVGRDSVQRALLSSGRPDLAASDDVRQLANEGLSQRVRLRHLVGDHLDSLDNQFATSTELFVGPLALARPRLSDARKELDNFYLSPLQTADTLAPLIAQRSDMLPELATSTLQTISSEDFPEASLATFPDPQDQARLVRNAIFSFATRGTLSPVLSIEDIRGFLEDSDSLTALANADPEDIAQAFSSESSTIDMTVATPYLHDLLFQVLVRTNTFLEKERPSLENPNYANIIFERDMLYRRFSDVFQLLHPALEETHLITDPTKAGEKDYSLWREDLAVTLGDHCIPRMSTLDRAIRAAEARGHSPSKFFEARELWRKYEISTQRERERISVIPKYIAEYEKTLATLDDPANTDVLLTKFFLNMEAEAHYDKSKRAFEYHHRVITQAHAIREAAEASRKEMTDTYGDAIPDSLPASENQLKKRDALERSKRATSLIAGERNLAAADQIMDEDRYGFEDLDYPTDTQLSTLSPEALDELKSTLLDHMTAIQDGGALPDFVARESVEALHSYIGEYLRLIKERTLHARFAIDNTFVHGDNQRERDYARTNHEMGAARYMGLEEQKRIFYLNSLNQRLAVIQLAQLGNRRISDSTKPVVVEPTIKSSEFVNRIAYDLTSTLPLTIDDEVLKTHGDELLTWHKFSTENKFYWPDTISTKEDLQNWITGIEHGMIETKRSTRHDLIRLEVQQMATQRLRSLLDNPLFPVDEGAGLSGDAFKNALNRRTKLISSLLAFELSTGVYEHFREEFLEEKKEHYHNFIQVRITRLRDEMQMLQESSPATKTFIKGMDGLSLVQHLTPSHSND